VAEPSISCIEGSSLEKEVHHKTSFAIQPHLNIPYIRNLILS